MRSNGILAACVISLGAVGLAACGGGSSSSSSSSSGSSGGTGSTSSTATYSVLYSFGSVTDDAQAPDSNLTLGSDGNLYGTTYSGGTQNMGTVFKISPSTGAETVVYSFGSVTGDGTNPAAGLLLGSDGNLYGTTYSGGGTNVSCNDGCGTVFRISTSTGAESVLYSFGSVSGDGLNPAASLIQGSDGTLYGTTYAGGDDADGTVFAFSPSTGAETILHSFAGTPSDGSAPAAVLLLGGDGNLYGTTMSGGNFKDGTIFRISPSGSDEILLYSFGTGVDDGQDPNASGLIEDSAGNFYGTTLEGGAYDKSASTGGTVFMYSPTSGVETVLYSFGSFSGDGARPTAGLIQGSDGNFYGTTADGGAHGSGTVFSFSPSSSSEAVLYSFGNFSGDGETPGAGLIQLSSGNFYGTTSAGGTAGSGTVFDFTVQ